ncbi:MAG: adenylate/guanylate cyclase domain-containing protein [Flavobacteriales bacterium]
MANILIVDDKDYNLSAYRMAIEDAIPSANIQLASNEIEARQKLKGEEKFDVVITDLMMVADEGGIDVLITAKEKDPLLMVIIVTAYEKKLDRYKAFDLGAFDCLEKGVPGVKTEQEIVVKTKNALKFRETALNLIASQKKLDFLRRYFDPRVYGLIENSPDLLNAKNRTVTIVFWDIRGFSLLSEILKAYPILIVGFLREFFEAASQIIFKNQGVLDKFLGDGVMALFGALNGKDKEGKQDSIAAVKCAIELRVAFDSILQKWSNEWKLYTPQAIEIGLGCGIHTGEAIVGNMGTESRDHYTAIGSHVNFAARIESKSEKGQIRVSQSTKVRAEEEFGFDFIETINDIKNIPGNFEIYKVK